MYDFIAGLLAMYMPERSMPGTSHGQLGARKKDSPAGTVSHQTATITGLRRKRRAAQAPGMLPRAIIASMMPLRRPSVKREAPRSWAAYT